MFGHDVEWQSSFGRPNNLLLHSTVVNLKGLTFSQLVSDVRTRHSDTFRFLLLTFIAVACIAGILIAGAIIICLRQNAKQRQKEKLAGLGPEGGTDTSLEYQELCRQHMAAYSRTETVDTSRVSSVSSQFSDAPQASPSSHNSTPS
eukprot:g29220.t1